MCVYESEPVIEHLVRCGTRLKVGIEDIVSRRRLGDYFKVLGRPSCLLYATSEANGASSQAFRSLFIQEMARRHVLAPSFVVSYSHTDADIDITLAAIDGALDVYGQALDSGVERFLIGRPSEVVYRRYNRPDAAEEFKTPDHVARQIEHGR
jgi:glutamate-1-semialdehyde 2,1-aminomutase